VELKHKDGKVERITCKHSLNADQIAWFKAGSALNLMSKL
jgi:aconitate hydratase